MSVRLPLYAFEKIGTLSPHPPSRSTESRPNLAYAASTVIEVVDHQSHVVVAHAEVVRLIAAGARAAVRGRSSPPDPGGARGVGGPANPGRAIGACAMALQVRSAALRCSR